jgi:hypothetical protein
MNLKEWLEDMKDRFKYWLDCIRNLFEIEITIELFETIFRFNILSFDISINLKLPRTFEYNFNEICTINKRLTKKWVFDFSILFYNTLRTGVLFYKNIHKHNNYRMCFDIYILGLAFASQIYYDLQSIEKEKNIYDIMFNKRFLRIGKKSKNKIENRIKKKINKILMEWDPIGVPPHAKYSEYVLYIDEIYSLGDNEKELKNYLKNLITNSIGLEYNSLQEKNTNKAVYKIILLYE